MSFKDLLYVLKLVSLVLILTFVVDKVIFSGLNQISDRVFTGQSVGKLNHYLKLKDDVDLIIFGSSRANHNIDPSLVSANGFNMGLDGRRIAYSSTLVKLLASDKKQTLFFQIDPKNAFDPSYKGSDVDALNIKYNRNKTITEEINKLKQNNFFQFFYWSIAYNSKIFGVLKNFLKPKYNIKKYEGYDPIFVNKNQLNIFLAKLKKTNKEECQDTFELNPLYDSYLDELKYFCEKKNKRIIFFTSPIYEVRCKKTFNQLKAVMDKKDLTYYDLTGFFEENNSIEYWKDETHLSNKGAELFSVKIKEILAE